MSDAILLTCHGTVTDLSDLPAFLANVRRGRPAPDALVHEVRRRYEAIGGSPLMETSREQAAALEERLGIPVRVAGRLWSPYPAEVLAELGAAGARRVLSLPLAPQSVHVYHAAVEAAAREAGGIEVVRAPPWGAEPALVDALCETVEEALGGAPAGSPPPPIVLTAHSLPIRVLRAGDPYESEFRRMAGLVAARFEPKGHRVLVAFQSQGATDDEWLGPDLAGTLREVGRGGESSVVVAPIGFLADHVETLFDLDVEAAAVARDAGIAAYLRAPAVGARPKLVDALEAVARRCLAGSAGSEGEGG